MPTLIQRGFALMNRTVGTAAGENVRYLRGATEIHSALPATLAAPQFELIDEGGATIIGRQFTWQLHRAELRWNGQEDFPRANDIIKWIHNGIRYWFVVQPEVGAEPEAGAFDPRSDWIPATTKLTKIEPV